MDNKKIIMLGLYPLKKYVCEDCYFDSVKTEFLKNGINEESLNEQISAFKEKFSFQALENKKCFLCGKNRRCFSILFLVKLSFLFREINLSSYDDLKDENKNFIYEDNKKIINLSSDKKEYENEQI